MSSRSQDLSSRPFDGLNGRTWRDQPASLLLFIILAALMLIYCALIDRTFLIDQQNYIDDFSQPWSWDSLTSYFDGGVVRGLVIATFSEELLWRAWMALCGVALNPQMAVLLTVGVLNVLIIASVKRLAGPTLALSLWILLPVGFAVIGLLQLRQGFAFAVMLFCALRLSSPVVGCLIAAMIHTTFVVPTVFAFLWRLCRSNTPLALVLAIFVACVGAYSGGVLFDLLGGRRLQTYSIDETASSSLNYVVAAFVCMLPSAYWLLTAARESSNQSLDRMISSLAVIHFGTTVFTVFSFFIFPLGTARVGYMNYLLLIPILPSVVARRDHRAALAISYFLFVYLLYLVGKTYLEGTYDLYLGL